MVRWCRGMAPPCPASHRHGTATPGVPHGDNCEVQCSPDVRKKPRFTHVRDNLRGDVRGKRFSAHAMERNVARIGEAGVETTKGCQVLGESDGKRVGRGWRVCRGQMWDCAGWELWG